MPHQHRYCPTAQTPPPCPCCSCVWSHWELHLLRGKAGLLNFHHCKHCINPFVFLIAVKLGFTSFSIRSGNSQVREIKKVAILEHLLCYSYWWITLSDIRVTSYNLPKGQRVLSEWNVVTWGRIVGNLRKILNNYS